MTSPRSAVDLATVGDGQHQHDDHVSLELVHDAVVSYPPPPPLHAGELLHVRAVLGVNGQRAERLNHPGLSLAVEALEISLCRLGEANRPGQCPSSAAMSSRGRDGSKAARLAWSFSAASSAGLSGSRSRSSSKSRRRSSLLRVDTLVTISVKDIGTSSAQHSRKRGRPPVCCSSSEGA